MPKQSEKKGIVLNRMYSGSYLSSNLGHEVINMYQADNGKYYIYLNSKGNFEKGYSNKIDKMLFVKHYAQGVFEVIGKAEGLEDVQGANKPLSRDVKDEEIFELQKDYVDNEGGVSYGGKSIFDIFNGAEQQSIFITYKAEKVYRTKKEKRIFICCKNLKGTISEEKEHNIKIIKLPEYNQALSSFKQYIYPTNEKSYNNLLNLINEKSLWEDNIKKVDRCELKSPRKVSLFDICQIQNNENCFSNALAYFMTRPEYYELWRNFFYEQCRISLNENFSVKREVDAKIEDKNWDHNNYPSGGRIDLLISDENNIVVIENKIKSDINKVETDGKECTQLNRYVNYVEWLVKKNTEKDKIVKKQLKFFILTPKYNIPIISDTEMKEKYDIITYADLYDYLKDNQSVFSDDANFNAFFEAMKRHTYENVNDYLYYEMQEKFFRRILE